MVATWSSGVITYKSGETWFVPVVYDDSLACHIICLYATWTPLPKLKVLLKQIRYQAHLLQTPLVDESVILTINIVAPNNMAFILTSRSTGTVQQRNKNTKSSINVY